MVNQAFRIKIAYRSEKEKEKGEEKKKIPGIGRYPMGPTINFLLFRNMSQKEPREMKSDPRNRSLLYFCVVSSILHTLA